MVMARNQSPLEQVQEKIGLLTLRRRRIDDELAELYETAGRLKADAERRQPPISAVPDPEPDPDPAEVADHTRRIRNSLTGHGDTVPLFTQPTPESGEADG